MTDWLAHGFRVAVISFAKGRARCRLIQNPIIGDGEMLTELPEPKQVAVAVGPTAEEAMANALNALMAQQGEENAKETNRS